MSNRQTEHLAKLVGHAAFIVTIGALLIGGSYFAIFRHEQAEVGNNGAKTLLQTKVASDTPVHRECIVQLSSTPSGAAVVLDGKVVGKTPFALGPIPAGAPLEIGLQLGGYFSTNFSIVSLEEGTVSRMIIMLPEHLPVFTEAAPHKQDVAVPQMGMVNNSDVSGRESPETEKPVVESEDQALAAQFNALPMLEPESIIDDCWSVADKSNRNFSKLNVVAAAKSNPGAIPGAAAADVIVKGMEIVAWPFKKRNARLPRFNQEHFVHNYQNRTCRYFGKIIDFDLTNGTIIFGSGGTSKRRYMVLTHLKDVTIRNDVPLQIGSSVWIFGNIAELEEANPANRLFLNNCVVYSPGKFSANR